MYSVASVFLFFVFLLLLFCQGWCFCDIVKNNDKIFKFQKLLLAVNRIFNLDYDCTTLCLYSTSLNTKFYKLTSNVLCAYIICT